MSINVIGVDLAAKPQNQTGIAVVNQKTVYIGTFFSDNEIMDILGAFTPFIVAIDAPLSLPLGRCCLERECECSEGGHFRQSDKEMRKYGGVLPLTFKGMKTLTFRGIELRNQIENAFPKIKIIETHPRTSQKLFKLNKEIKTTFNDLESFFEIKNLNQTNKKEDKTDSKSWEETNQHEIDGALAALSAVYYLSGRYHELGTVEEGVIIVPDVNIDLKSEISTLLEKVF